MKFRERAREELGIDLTPLIDVVFMLLLFFVVTTTLFKGATQLGIQLPKANAENLNKEKNVIEIGVDAKGQYYLNGKPVGSNQAAKLKAALATQLKGKSAAPVLLVGDGNAPHQAIVSALEVTSELGISQVQIVAQRST